MSVELIEFLLSVIYKSKYDAHKWCLLSIVLGSCESYLKQLFFCKMVYNNIIQYSYTSGTFGLSLLVISDIYICP